MIIDRILRRIYMLVGRGETRVVDDTKVVQLTQIVFGPVETQDNVPRLAEYGLTSNPPSGSDCITIFVGGDRTNGVTIATGHKESRPTDLQPGEVCVYSKFGSSVLLKKNGDIEVTSPTKVKFIAPNAEFTGDVLVDGTLTANTDVIGGGKHLKTHTHSGVTAGGANTGPPT